MRDALPQSRKRPAGFTLVEVLVVLVITVAIATVSIAAFRGQTNAAAVRRARDVLVADLRTQQQSSLAGKTISVCSSGPLRVCPADGSCVCQSVVPVGGYGVYVATCSPGATPCTYALFADLDHDGAFDYFDANGNGRYDGGETGDELIPGAHFLDRPITIAELTPTVPGCPMAVSDSWSAVVFAPYRGNATLGGSSRCLPPLDGTRWRETVTLGPAIPGSANVQFVIHRDLGGIQE